MFICISITVTSWNLRSIFISLLSNWCGASHGFQSKDAWWSCEILTANNDRWISNLNLFIRSKASFSGSWRHCAIEILWNSLDLWFRKSCGDLRQRTFWIASLAPWGMHPLGERQANLLEPEARKKPLVALEQYLDLFDRFDLLAIPADWQVWIFWGTTMRHKSPSSANADLTEKRKSPYP